MKIRKIGNISEGIFSNKGNKNNSKEVTKYDAGIDKLYKEIQKLQKYCETRKFSVAMDSARQAQDMIDGFVDLMREASNYKK